MRQSNMELLSYQHEYTSEFILSSYKVWRCMSLPKTWKRSAEVLEQTDNIQLLSSITSHLHRIRLITSTTGSTFKCNTFGLLTITKNTISENDNHNAYYRIYLSVNINTERGKRLAFIYSNLNQKYSCFTLRNDGNTMCVS